MIHQNETNRLADTEYGLATRGCKAARRCSDSFCRKLRFRESWLTATALFQRNWNGCGTGPAPSQR